MDANLVCPTSPGEAGLSADARVCTPPTSYRRCFSGPGVRRRVLAGTGLATLGLALITLLTSARPARLTAVRSNHANETTGLMVMPCGHYPYLKFAGLGLRLKRNNLGNEGPFDNQPEGMIYHVLPEGSGAGKYEAQLIDMHINALTSYDPFSSKMNGFSGQYGVINVNAGSETELSVRFFEHGTTRQITMGKVAFTFFDLDTGTSGACRESVTAKDFDSVVVLPNTEINSEKAGDWVRFSATKVGTGDDNPKDPDALTVLQKSRAISMLFIGKHEIRFKIGAGDPASAGSPCPRFFSFIGRASLLCDSNMLGGKRPSISKDGLFDHLQPYDPNGKLKPAVDDVEPLGIPLSRDSDKVQAITGEGTLEEWVKTQPLEQGETIARIKVDGYVRDVTAPISGPLLAVQSKILAGSKIKKGTEIAVIGPPGAEVISVPAEAKFMEWSKKEGEVVQMHETIALVKDWKSGREKDIKAPKSGQILSVQQRLVPGSLMPVGTTLAVIGKQPPLTTRAGDAEALMPEAPGGSLYFQDWCGNVGDWVEKGECIAHVSTERGGSLRRLTLGSGASSITVEAPMAGEITKKVVLSPGEKLDEALEGSAIAVIETPGPPLWLWMLLLLLASVFICLICFLRRQRRAKRRTPEEAPLVAQERGPATPGLIVFADDNGDIFEKQFEYRPHGIAHEAGTPMKVGGFIFNSYAKTLGVKKGWKVVQIGGEDVRHVHSYAVLTEKWRATLAPFPVWPLRLDLQEKKKKEPVTYMITEKPIGLEFHHKIPIVVSRIHKGSIAEKLGCKKAWTIVRVGDVEVDTSMPYEEFMDLIHRAKHPLDLEDGAADDEQGIVTPSDAEAMPDDGGEDNADLS